MVFSFIRLHAAMRTAIIFPVSAYNKLGSPASHGCIRTCVGDAKWVYYNSSGSTIYIFDGTYNSNESFKGHSWTQGNCTCQMEERRILRSHRSGCIRQRQSETRNFVLDNSHKTSTERCLNFISFDEFKAPFHCFGE